MEKSFRAMEASALTAIKCARASNYGRTYRIALGDFAESGGLCAYLDGKPVYRKRNGARTFDLFGAVESYAEKNVNG